MISARRTALFCLITGLVTPATWAADAHVHGHARIDIALEGNELEIALNSPMDNLVGFEHAPTTDAQKHAIHEAEETLEAPAKLIELPAAAGCRLEEAEVELAHADDHDEHHEHGHEQEHKPHHDDHGHEKGHKEHGHDDHGHGKAHKEHAHDDHGHEKEHKEHAHHDDHGHAGETHSDGQAHYHFECGKPAQLKSIDFAGLFKRFPNFEEIDVQAVGPHGQAGAELKPGSTRFRF